MRVLIVGGGGREHALAWSAGRSDLVDHVFVAPGNAGTSLEPNTTNIAISAEDVEGQAAWARNNQIDLVIIGPEVPLTLGIANEFHRSGIKCFGPSAQAAQLEGSKDFTKRFLVRHNIPTARFETFYDAAAACEYIDEIGVPVVVKADGLAAGKGVVVAETIEQAKDAANDMMRKRMFGPAGERVVVEDYLTGEEASYICMVDGEEVLPLAASQDHKAAYDGDTGPNTGGMGAYSPTPVVDNEMEQKVLNRIIRPTVEGLMKEGIRYTGFLYAGLMIDSEGNPQILEYNCRLGDPEAQPLMFRLKSDLIELILAALDDRLETVTAEWDERTTLGVVVAANGYPGSYAKGHPISGLTGLDTDEVKIFHAGTNFDARGNLVSTGGRVLCVTALAPDVRQAQTHAYQAIEKISMENMHYRTDIGNKALSH